MQKIVQTLLTLARYDAGQLKSQRESIAVRPFVLSIWKVFEEKTAFRQIDVHFDTPADFSINTDRDFLETALMNLFENAVEYTPPGGGIEWKTDQNHGGFVFSISNSVSNLTPVDISHLCDRFWQKDPARSSNELHSGLGLSLVRSLADTLNLTLQIHLADENRLNISLIS